MKLLTCLGVVGLLMFVNTRHISNLGQNSYFGTKGLNDSMISICRAARDSKFARNVSMEVRLPPRDQKTRGVITYVEALDMDRDGTGGYARLKEGGIGQREVTLRLVSQRGKPIDFIIRVYGKIDP